MNILFQAEILENIAKILGDTATGLTGSEIERVLLQTGLNDVEPGITKWKRLYIAFADYQNRTQSSEKIQLFIKNALSPIRYANNETGFSEKVEQLNKILVFAGIRYEENGTFSLIEKAKTVAEAQQKAKNVKENSATTEQEFLSKNFSDGNISKLGLEASLVPVIQQRLNEIDICIENNAPLSAVFLCGSTLEGILIGIAQTHPKEFNTANATPKDEHKKTKPFYDWNLATYIDVAAEIGFIDLDVKKFSHALRDFRNYIHPYEQMANHFNPTIETAKISVQVLKAAISQLCSR